MVRVATSNVVLAIDIETGGDGIGFPDKGEHPVFQISCLVGQVGCDQPSSQTLFTWKRTAGITGVDLVVMEDEAAMLTRFSSFVIQINPDVITGFNVCAFDLKYLIERMQKLRLSTALCIGRTEGSPMCFVIRSSAERVFLFKDGSYSRGVEVFIPGRVVHDVYQWITNQHHFIKTVSNPRPYSLEACALHFLKDCKGGVKWQQIVPMFNGTDADRSALAVYCLKDARLALLLMNLLSKTCPEVKRFFEVTSPPAHTMAAVAAVAVAATNELQPPVLQTDASQVKCSTKRQRGALQAACDDGHD
jgi:DNA polymerase delta subunit 1